MEMVEIMSRDAETAGRDSDRYGGKNRKNKECGNGASGRSKFSR